MFMVSDIFTKLLKLIYSEHSPFLYGLPNLTFCNLRCLIVFLSSQSKHLYQVHLTIFHFLYMHLIMITCHAQSFESSGASKSS